MKEDTQCNINGCILCFGSISVFHVMSKYFEQGVTQA